MKHTKVIMCFALALMVLLSSSIPAFATEAEAYTCGRCGNELDYRRSCDYITYNYVSRCKNYDQEHNHTQHADAVECSCPSCGIYYVFSGHTYVTCPYGSL